MTNRLTSDMIDTYIGSIDMEATRNDIDNELKNLNSQKEEFKKSLFCDDDIKDVIFDKIISTDSKYLEIHSRNDKYIRSLFTTEDGELIHFNMKFDSDAKEIEFMRSFAIWLNTSEKMIRDVTDEIDKYQKEVDSLHIELDKNIYNISDNILNYIQYLRDQAKESGDQNEIDKTETLTKYMESAYNMNVYKETIEEHPGIVGNTIRDLETESRVEQVGSRYMSKLKRNKLHANLVQFASSDTKKSFEEMHLLKEDYKYKDLFVFSLIRFFSMADWSDQNIKRMHATTYIVLRNIEKNELDMTVRKNILDSIREYLKLFNK